MTSSLWRPLLLGVVLIASYCFNSSKYLLNSSSNKLASVKASFWFPQNETRTYEHRKQNVLQDNNLFAFMMRDANRMVAIDPPFGMYIFDYINVHGESISASSNQMQLYLNGRKIGGAPCEEYSIRCYKAKMLQIFHYVANHTRSQYLFYMESDNTLCVPLSELKRIAQTQSRYFVGTGIGASGWIMSRPFLLDFMARYESGVDDDDRPDVVASKLLTEDKSNEKGWAVTRQYLVAHTLMQPIGGQGLTIRKPSQSNKRLPRCLEPHRGMWVNEEKLGIDRKREDKYGWDYFDFDACPDSDIYPCNRPDVKKNSSSKRDSYTNIGYMKDPMHHNRRVRYAGVLVDTARVYFSISDLKDIVDFIAKLGFNLLHLRLTDDQSFMLKFDSYPELAVPSVPGGSVYSVEEMKHLVEFAAERRVFIMPELNIPGHAGGWSGIPGLIVNCPKYFCEEAWGIPLDHQNAGLMSILETLLGELKEIFHSSPFIHLGGDEMKLSRPCFLEAGRNVLDTDKFERDLQSIVSNTSLTSPKIVRWEDSITIALLEKQQETVTHYWYRSPRDEKGGKPRMPYFVSSHLYVDTMTDQDDAWHMFQDVRGFAEDTLYPPLGIIAGAFELTKKSWLDRNVYGKLVAMSMALSKNTGTATIDKISVFQSKYLAACISAKPAHLDKETWRNVCNTLGKPILGINKWRSTWEKETKEWKRRICIRLNGTLPSETRK